MSELWEKNPVEMLFHWEEHTPDKVYFRQPIDDVWHTYTWKETADQVRRMASAIKAMGFPDRSRIAISGRNTAHWIMADMAVGLAGHISVGLYPKMATDSVRYVMEHSDAKAIILGPLEEYDGLDRGIPDHVVRIKKPYAEVTMRADHEWDDLIAANEPMTEYTAPPLDEVWTLVYTSGTTGNPKGAMITGINTMFGAKGLLQAFPAVGEERLFSYLPLAHIFERGVTETASLYLGAEVSFLERLDKFAENLAHVAPTRFAAVPLVWEKLQYGILQKLPQEKIDKIMPIPLLGWYVRRKVLKGVGLQNARICLSGAAPLPKKTLEWFDVLGIKILQGYAMTENACYGTANRPDENRYGSVGKPLPGAEFKIADDGEILCRHDAVMKGYYLQDDKTAETITDGWLHTGDRGKFDDDGFLYVTGRVKDIFKTKKGKYVAPAKLEALLSRPDFEAICVTGSGLKQPVVLAKLTPETAALDKDTVTAFLESHLDEVNKELENHEKVSHILLVPDEWTIDNGMMTPTMKIKRHTLEERYNDTIAGTEEQSERVVWV